MYSHKSDIEYCISNCFRFVMEACRDLVIELFAKEGLECVVKGDEVTYHKTRMLFEKNDQKYMASVRMGMDSFTCFHPRNEKVEEFAVTLVNFLKKEKAHHDEAVAKYGFIPKEQADKAAQWWADQLRGKKRKYTELPAIGALLFEKLEASLVPADQRIDKFEELLSRKLQEEVANHYGVTLSVDYDPMGLLYEAWKESATPGDHDDGFGRFPIKTNMRVYGDKVVLDGGAEYINGKYIQKITPI